MRRWRYLEHYERGAEIKTVNAKITVCPVKSVNIPRKSAYLRVRNHLIVILKTMAAKAKHRILRKMRESVCVSACANAAGFNQKAAAAESGGGISEAACSGNGVGAAAIKVAAKAQNLL